MNKAILALVMFSLAGCEEAYYPGTIQVPAYAPIDDGWHAGYIQPPLGNGRPVGGYGYSGYGSNIMITPPIGGPVGSTIVTGY